MPRSRAATATGSMPGTGRSAPSRPSSPMRRKSVKVAQLERAVSAEDADGHGQVEAGAFFLDVGGSEVDGDVGGREVEAGVADGGADAVAGFAHGGVGKADGVEVILRRSCIPEKSTSTSMMLASMP